MADLQQVDDRQATTDQHAFDRCLGVAGQQRREPAVPERHHHRAVVDVALRQRRRGIGVGRVEDLDRHGRVEQEPLAGPRERRVDEVLRGIGDEPVVRRILERDSGVQHGADPEAIEDVHQSGDVILVRMAQHEQVDPTREER